MAIPEWNAQHFLTVMLKEFIRNREYGYYYRTLQLSHLHCDWKFTEQDVRLLNAFGDSLEEIESWSWYEVMSDPSLNPRFIEKHHSDCLEVCNKEGQHEQLIMRQIELGNTEIKTISYMEGDLISRPETQIENIMSEIDRLVEQFEQCENCGYGKSKRTGACAVCIDEGRLTNA